MNQVDVSHPGCSVGNSRFWRKMLVMNFVITSHGHGKDIHVGTSPLESFSSILRFGKHHQSEKARVSTGESTTIHGNVCIYTEDRSFIYRHDVYCLILFCLMPHDVILSQLLRASLSVGALKLGIEQAENVESKNRVQALSPSRWVQYWDHCGA